MKKMSRLLALVMALVLALGTFTTAMAEDSTGYALGDLTAGLLQGWSDAIWQKYATEFYNELMAAATQDEYDAVMATHTDKVADKLISSMTDEQIANLYAHNVELSAVNGEAIAYSADGVAVNAPAGAFPSGTEANVAAVTDETVLAALATAIAAVDDTAAIVDAYDISFNYTALGVTDEVQPKTSVELNFDVAESGLYTIYHMVADNADGYVAEVVDFAVVEAGAISTSVDTFSIYVVTDTTDTTGTQVTNNSTYEMTVGETRVFYNSNTNNRGLWHVTDENNEISYSVVSRNYQGNQYSAPWVEVTAIRDAQLGTATEETITLTYSYIYNSNIRTETFYIRVVEPDTFYVSDQIAETGCLVPLGLENESGVTYTWTRSDGQTIRSEALNEDGSVNVSLDRGGVTNSRTPITYTVTATRVDSNGNTITNTAAYEVLYGNEILNPSFENPTISSNYTNVYYYNGYPGLYWKTTAPGSTSSQLSQDIELIREGSGANGSYGVQYAADGSQFAELNAENFGALYQDILTTSGAELSWSFSHAARTTAGSNNIMYVIVGPTASAQSITNSTTIDDILTAAENAAGTRAQIPETGMEFTYDEVTYKIWRHNANENTSTWENISGSYKVPANQYLTRLMFVSDTTGSTGVSQTSTLGNLIDAVSAGEHMSYAILYYPDGNLASDKTEEGNGTVYTTVEPANLQSYLDQGYIVTGVTVNGYNYSGDIDDLLYITEYKTASDYTKPSGYTNTTIVVQITLRKKAITVTKNVEIDGWDAMSEEERSALLADGYSATFGLYEGETQVATATANIAYNDEGQSLTALVEFATKPNNGGAFEPEYKTYTVKEISEGPIDGYTLDGDPVISPTSVTLSATNPTANVTVTNKYKVANGKLTISKTVTKDATAADFPTTDAFEFTVNLTKDGAALTGTYPYTGSASGNIAHGGKITLTNGQSITIEGLPAGTQYSVVESAKDYYTATASTLSGNITAGATATAAFTNTYNKLPVGNLTITKTVKDSEFTSGDKTFSFALALNNGSEVANKQFIEWATAKGYYDETDKVVEMSVTVSAAATNKSNSLALTGLPVGNYTVTETTVEGYNTTYAPAYGTVDVTAVETPATVTVTNTATGTYSTLEATKIWNDNSDALGYRPDSVVLTLVGKVGETDFAHDKTALSLTDANAYVDPETEEEDGDVWVGSWTNVPMYDADGNLITYSVAETAPDKYEANIEGMTVTNSITVGVLKVTKTGMKEKDSAIFTVTINGVDYLLDMQNESRTFVAAGGSSYNVSEDESWSTRYTPTLLSGNKSGSITAGTVTEIAFKNDKSEQWLTDEWYVENTIEKQN